MHDISIDHGPNCSIHSFIHSAPSTSLLLRGAPAYSTDTVLEFHAEAHRQLQVEDLPKVPTWRLERESNPQPSGWKSSTQPRCHHVPQIQQIPCDWKTNCSNHIWQIFKSKSYESGFMTNWCLLKIVCWNCFQTFKWFIAVRSPKEIWEQHQTYLIVELCLYFLALLTFKHGMYLCMCTCMSRCIYCLCILLRVHQYVCMFMYASIKTLCVYLFACICMHVCVGA